MSRFEEDRGEWPKPERVSEVTYSDHQIVGFQGRMETPFPPEVLRAIQKVYERRLHAFTDAIHFGIGATDGRRHVPTRRLFDITS